MRSRLAGRLALGTVLCAGLALWAAAVQRRAKSCLDGDLTGVLRATSIRITERGCEITTDSGVTVLAMDGPPFEVGVAAVLGFVVLGLALVVVMTRPRERVHASAGPADAPAVHRLDSSHDRRDDGDRHRLAGS